MKNKAELRLVLKDKEQVEAVLRALAHEEDFKKRSVSIITRNGNEIIIKVESEDVVSLRASLNAYLRDIQVIEGIEKDYD